LHHVHNSSRLTQKKSKVDTWISCTRRFNLNVFVQIFHSRKGTELNPCIQRFYY
jgi:hypothetical protein